MAQTLKKLEIRGMTNHENENKNYDLYPWDRVPTLVFPNTEEDEEEESLIDDDEMLDEEDD